MEGISLYYVNPEDDKVGIILNGCHYELHKEALLKFCEDARAPLSKEYKEYTYFKGEGKIIKCTEQ